MPTSDEELAAKAASVEKLRSQVTEAQATLVNRQRELANDVTANALDREAEKLQSQLALLKEQGKVANVRDGAAAVVDPEGTAAKHEDAKQAALAETGDLPAVAAEAAAADSGASSKRGGSR